MSMTAALFLLLAVHAVAAQGRVCATLEDCNAIVRTNPSLAVYERRGCLHLQRRDLDQAIADFGAAIDLDRGRAFSLYGRGMARLMAGDAAGQNEMEAAVMLQRDVAEEFKTCGAK